MSVRGSNNNSIKGAYVFEVELDRSAFHMCDVVSGHVVLDAAEELKVRSVRVQLRGKAHSEWRFVRGNARQIARGDQQFIDDRRTLWGVDRREAARVVAVLPRGPNRWGFAFRLPSSPLPPSFESRLASIRYFVRASLELGPGAGGPVSAQKYFSLLPAGASLELQERLRQPLTMNSRRGLEAASSACCPALPCFAPPLCLNVALGRSGYCSGEEMRLCCSVGNGLDRALRIRLQLVQLAEVIGAVGEAPASKQIERLACQWFSEAVKARQVTDLGAWKRLRLPVLPPSLPNSLCDLLNIRYVLRFNICEMEEEALVPKQRPLHLEIPVAVLGRPLGETEATEGATAPIVLRCCVANVEGGGFCGSSVHGGSSRGVEGGTGGFQPLYPFVPDQVEARQLAVNAKSFSPKKEKCTEKISSV